MIIQAKKFKDGTVNETLHQITERVDTLRQKRLLRLRLYQECPHLEYFTIISHKSLKLEEQNNQL